MLSLPKTKIWTIRQKMNTINYHDAIERMCTLNKDVDLSEHIRVSDCAKIIVHLFQLKSSKSDLIKDIDMVYADMVDYLNR